MKRGQVALFAIIAVVIIAVILLFLFWPRIISIGAGEINPQVFLQSCLKDTINEGIALLSSQGGSINPPHSIMYDGQRIDYLCYTNKFYETCVMQQPLLKQHVEYELNNYIRPEAEECVQNLVSELESQGYEVSNSRPQTVLSIESGVIQGDIVLDLLLRRQTTQSYDSVEFNVPSNLYKTILIAQSILNYEAKYGDADIWSYMIYYPDTKVEKFKQGDGSKIYIITNRDSGQEFVFATRSLAWPSGFASL